MAVPSTHAALQLHSLQLQLERITPDKAYGYETLPPESRRMMA